MQYTTVLLVSPIAVVFLGMRSYRRPRVVMALMVNVVNLLQVVAGAAVCNVSGFLWYSELFFGRIWWRHTFPGLAFGDSRQFKSAGNTPYYITFIACVIQSSLLTYAINTIIPHVPIGYSGIRFPLLMGLFLAAVISLTRVPHFVYSMKSLPLLLISCGYDVVQVMGSVFAIYYLAPQ
jgi:hypothetical protein